MTSTRKYLHLTNPPALLHPGNPTCEACLVDTDHDGDNWVCPSCGTAWPGGVYEADPKDATLFPDWSGEPLTGPVCPNDVAATVSSIRDPDERDAAVRAATAHRDPATT